MRTALIVWNSLIAGTSAGLLAYTVAGRDHFVGLAEEYVIGKTVGYGLPAIDRAEAALDAPVVAALLPATVRRAAQAEIAVFREDPDGYVRELVARGAAVERPQHPLADTVAGWKDDLRGYFERTLAGLVRDVRIFAGTNVAAGVFAAWLASRCRGRWRHHVLGISVLLTVALTFNAYLFVDGLSFFRIVQNVRVGWSYPAMVAVAFSHLYLRVGRLVPLAGPVTRSAS